MSFLRPRMHLRTTIRLPPQVRPLPFRPSLADPPFLTARSPSDSAWQTQIESRLTSLTSAVSSILTALEARGTPVPLSEPLDTRPIVSPAALKGNIGSPAPLLDEKGGDAEGASRSGTSGSGVGRSSEEGRRDERGFAQPGNVFLSSEAAWPAQEES